MAAAAVYYVVFGVLAAAGGVLGWVRARSVASVVAGLASGVALFAAGQLGSGGNRAGHWIAAVVSALLLARFGPAWARGKAMPGAPMTVLSVVGLIVSAWALAGA
ncbi:MAG TPA: TMEM14 family protein [Verrucomicrobiae bacterium]|nr:TMEM14 family protein [Verrucomicrobiae bacterium]